MVVYYDHRFTHVKFGMERLRGALDKAGLFFVERYLFDYAGNTSKDGIITVSFTGQDFLVKPCDSLEAEGFEIRVEEETIHVLGADINGAMYGLLELAEDINLYGISGVKSKVRNPFMKKRGFKFNLPFEPFDFGDPFDKNISACLDRDFWTTFIDFLAEQRYNVLSLWSEHPYHMMFRLEKYPDACPYSDAELERYKSLYKYIFAHCKELGIKVYFITWNIRITPFVAKALGLPEEFGDMSGQITHVYDGWNKIPNPSSSMYPARQAQQVIKDYMKECIRTLLLTYTDLSGIGTNCAEEMSGDAYTRQQWVIDTYLEAIKESGRAIPFIMRTNMGNGKVASAFMAQYPHKEKYISWKYSNAHMYSSENPQFEKLWDAWDGVDMKNVRVMYTIRNDDFHSLRWADFGYIQRYLSGAKKDYVDGFYWGADGYLWAEDFQTPAHFTKQWKYDFDRNWTQFWLMGRLGYNANEDESRFKALFDRHYGKWSGSFYNLLNSASKLVPAVNRLAWINYDFQWNPESLLSVLGMKSVLYFAQSEAMPGIGTMSIPEYVAAVHSGGRLNGETPEDILKIIDGTVKSLEAGIALLENDIPSVYRAGEVGATLTDLICWKNLSMYYYLKLSAAIELAFFSLDKNEARKEKAVSLLEQGLGYYKELAFNWSRQYTPYYMARVKRLFNYAHYYGDAEKDIDLAKNFKG